MQEEKSFAGRQENDFVKIGERFAQRHWITHETFIDSRSGKKKTFLYLGNRLGQRSRGRSAMVNLSIQYNHFLIDGIVFYLCALTVNGEDGGEVSEEFLRDSLFLRVVHWRTAEGNTRYE